MNIRHTRQSFLGNNSAEILTGTKVGIIGLCGGGSHIAQQLAHIGIGHFVLADFDYVENPNLNRMVGSCPADAELNRLKTNVIKELVHRINPDAVIDIVGCWQEGGELFRTCDIIVGCVDNFTSRSEIEQFCRRFLIPYIDIGMDVHNVSSGYVISGQVALSIPGSHCLWCHGILTEDRLVLEQRNYGAAGGKPQVIWPNGVLASIAVGHAISLLLPWSADLPLYSVIEYDGNRHITRPGARLQYLKDVPCAHYAKETSSVGDPFYSIAT